jgi:hypothetical protein
MGRFIERDPIGFEAGDNNWYRFAANQPNGRTDPSGLKINGTTTCDLNAPVDAPLTIEIFNTKCTKSCTQEHENQHAADLRPCCQKARAAYKLQKTAADRTAVRARWNEYARAARPWTECNAYTKSIACAEKLLIQKAGDKQCCADASAYKKNAERNKDEYCGKSKGEPVCPF